MARLGFEEAKGDYRRLDDMELGKVDLILKNHELPKLMDGLGSIDQDRLMAFISEHCRIEDRDKFLTIFQEFYNNNKLAPELSAIQRSQLRLALKAALLGSASRFNLSLYRYPGSKGSQHVEASDQFAAFDGGQVIEDGLGCCSSIDYDTNDSSDCLTGFELGYLAGGGDCNPCGGDLGDDDDAGAACGAMIACLACIVVSYVTVVSLVACAGTGIKTMTSARDDQGRPDTKVGRGIKIGLVGAVMLGAAVLWYATPGASTSIADGLAGGLSGMFRNSTTGEVPMAAEVFADFSAYIYGGIVAVVSLGSLACCTLGSSVFRCFGFDPVNYLHKQSRIAASEAGISQKQLRALIDSDYTKHFLHAQRACGPEAVKGLMIALDAVKVSHECSKGHNRGVLVEELEFLQTPSAPPAPKQFEGTDVACSARPKFG